MSGDFPARPPEGLLDVVYQATTRRDAHALAALMHPDALNAYRDAWIAYALCWAERTKGSGEEPGSGGVVMTGLDAELLKKWEMTPIKGLVGIDTIGGLAALSPEELLSRTVPLLDHLTPDPTEGDSRRGLRVLGAIVENDLAHILYRQGRSRGGRPPWEPELITAKKSEGQWLLMAPLGLGPVFFELFQYDE